VFGAKGATASFRLDQTADSVKIEAIVGEKVVKTVTRKNLAAGTVKIAARGIKRGAVQFRITAVRGNTVLAQTAVTATRL
jgi:hypothetical protein